MSIFTIRFWESLFSFSISFCSRDEAHSLCKKYVQHIAVVVVVEQHYTTTLSAITPKKFRRVQNFLTKQIQLKCKCGLRQKRDKAVFFCLEITAMKYSCHSICDDGHLNSKSSRCSSVKAMYNGETLQCKLKNCKMRHELNFRGPKLVSKHLHVSQVVYVGQHCLSLCRSVFQTKFRETQRFH